MQHNPAAGLTREWLQIAAEDLAMADLAMTASPPLLSGAVYHCQQAFEKALKALLTWHGSPFRRTHDLTELVQLCEQLDPIFSALVGDAAMVSPYVADFRYPPVPGQLSQSDAAAVLGAARNAFAFVLQRLPPVTHP